MFLLIDPSEKDKIHLALFNEKVIEHKIYSGRNREILSCIQKVVKSYKVHKVIKFKSVNDIEGIMVVVGAGGFTSTRVACVVANSFAYVLQIPLLAIKLSEVNNIQKLIPKLLKRPKGHYLSATYSGEPNIGKKK